MKAIDCIDRWVKEGLLVFVLCTSWSGEALAVQSQNNPQPPPNILLIYIDDLGYGDVGVYGSGKDPLVNTPNIDKLAESGMRFTQGYAPAPLCSPSRAAMLTGKGVARLGFEFVTKYPGDDRAIDHPEWLEKHKDFALLPPPYTLDLPLEEVTLAEALKERGYRTGIVGKWHVASHHKQYKGWSQTHGPRQQGFDYAVETFGTHPYAGGNEAAAAVGEYPRDELTEHVIEFIQKEHDQPFFLMASFYFVHTPLKKNIPWLHQKIRENAAPGTPEKLIHYAVNVSLMDHYVGQITGALQQAGLQGNTLVIFTSDNGGHPEYANNGSFRGSKWNLYEGGIRVPMLVSLPGMVPEGSVSDEVVSQLDFMPTFLDLAGGIPVGFAGDGKSMIPVLSGGDEIREERALLWHFPYYHPEGSSFFSAKENIGVRDGLISQTKPHSAMRWGAYKLIYHFEDGKTELYKLDEDPSESRDLSQVQDDIRQQLMGKMMELLEDADARLPVKKSGLTEHMPDPLHDWMNDSLLSIPLIPYNAHEQRSHSTCPELVSRNGKICQGIHSVISPD